MKYKLIASLAILLIAGKTFAQNMGIGTTNPQHVLDISGAGNFSRAHLKLTETGTDFTRLRFGSSGTGHSWDVASKASNTFSSAAMHFYFSGASANVLTLRGDGNVGINNSDPINALDIAANSDFNRAQLRIHETQPDFSRIRMTNTSGANWWDLAAKPFTVNSSAYLTFYYSALGQNVLTMRGDGNVGIGNPDPSNILDVQGNTDFNKVHIRIHETDADYTRVRMTNTTGGNFWDMAARPDVNNTSAFMNFYYQGLGANVLSLQGNGNAVLAGTLTQNSDMRLKQNIRPINNALDKILSLHGYNYNWIDINKDNGLQSGVLAQEVREVLPELVKEDKNGVLSVNYSGIIPVLIEAIKEQQKRIMKLEEALQKVSR
jgi:Chaperone of endosialidase